MLLSKKAETIAKLYNEISKIFIKLEQNNISTFERNRLKGSINLMNELIEYQNLQLNNLILNDKIDNLNNKRN
jgi:hypothetical protein